MEGTYNLGGAKEVLWWCEFQQGIETATYEYMLLTGFQQRCTVYDPSVRLRWVFAILYAWQCRALRWKLLIGCQVNVGSATFTLGY